MANGKFEFPRAFPKNVSSCESPFDKFRLLFFSVRKIEKLKRNIFLCQFRIFRTIPDLPDFGPGTLAETVIRMIPRQTTNLPPYSLHLR